MHTLSWLTWLIATAVVITSTRNPLILLLLLGVFVLISDRLSHSEVQSAPILSPLRFAFIAIPVGALFNGLTSHFGQTVLINLPKAIPLFGGQITAEALVYGAINGLVLTTLFFAFSVFNQAVSVGVLIQYVPRAFYPFAVVSAIAISFYPNTVRQIQQVRDAQVVRGHRMRGLKDWLPLFVPVLVGGLERALHLAEAMTSRGFASDTRIEIKRDIWVSIASMSGICLVLAGTVARLLPAWSSWSLLFIILGTVSVLWAMWKAGRAIHRTRYNPVMWAKIDSLAAVASLVALVPVLVLNSSAMDYSPYPLLSWPRFDLVTGLMLLGVVCPVWFAGSGDEVSGD